MSHLVYEMTKDYNVHFESDNGEGVYFTQVNGAVPRQGEKVWIPKSIVEFPECIKRVKKVIWSFEDYWQREIEPGLTVQRVGRSVHVVLEPWVEEDEQS